MGGATGLTEAAVFVPEIWSDEVIAAYQSNLTLANLVKKMSMAGKKGDTINIPAPTRGTATAKAENTAVTLQGNTEGDINVSIDKHFEYSRLIEDIVDVQALASLRQFYTGDAGYALAKQVDTDLFGLGVSFGNNDADYAGTGSYYIDASTGLTQYDHDTMVAGDGAYGDDGSTNYFDDALRNLIQKLDDNDVPMDGRALVVPPVLRNVIMGIDRYTSSDFVTGNVVNNGQIGNLYGVDIYVSSNCPVIETDAANSNATGYDAKQAMIFHKDSMVLVEQQGIRSQTQYKQEYLGNLYTADTIYGTGVLRDDAAFNLIVAGS
tara:strand:- start:390 stop:1352 length:963 start_codon:yes stop_codon:yes gene_type:complete